MPAANLLRFPKMSENRKTAKLLAEARRRGYQHGVTFSLPAGYTCPFAHDCASRADRVTGKITDGEHTQFRCFAASMENRHGSVRASRWHNFDTLRAAGLASAGAMAEELLLGLRASGIRAGSPGIVRVHVSGDFFNRHYMNAWQTVAAALPESLFYAYTKAIPYIIDAGELPDNLRIVASVGGTHDDRIPAWMPTARVVFSEAEADALGLVIDHDDTCAAFGSGSFALLIHGNQPKGTDAARAVRRLQLAAV